MDYFSLCLNIFCLLVQGAMHILFAARLTGKKPKARYFITYLSLIFLLEWYSNKTSLPWIIAIGMELLLLYGVSRFIMGSKPSVSWVAAVLALYISQLSFGLINSAEALLFPYAVGTSFLYLLLIAATAVSFAFCAACYAAVLKSISLKENDQIANMSWLTFPVLFFFTAELYIMQTSYTQTLYPDFSSAYLLKYTSEHIALLFLQALGLGSLFGTLYAYRKLCHSFQAQAQLHALTQAAYAQKIYITEAQIRYEQTRAFRHDITNHLSVLDGLLHSGRLDEGNAYLQKLKAASASLSFPYQTGNPVVDILLREKLGLAEEITAEISLLFPKPFRIDDFDLCVIFANALDNAIRACQSTDGTRSIRIRGECQGDFYMLEFENTCSEGPLPPEGTGLSNIRSAAEKYGGVISTEKRGSCFSLNVLLNISAPPECISVQTH